mmetsp:Transcript_12593/g.39702  ORF Transcript_12593/g.39702 Transcript_12593/m.39702 type:complete len:298 (+) Transcript_12593:44-937(+)
MPSRRPALPLAGCFLALAAPLASALRAERRAPPPAPERYYYFKGYHKTGTALINHLCDHLKKTVTGSEDLCARCSKVINASAGGRWCERVWSDAYTLVRSQDFYAAPARFFCATPLDDVQRIGGDYRAAHILRDPLTLLASAYIYDQKGADHVGFGGGKELGALSRREGLRLKAVDMGEIMRQILAGHELARKDPHVLEVRFEDFRADFDGAASKLFSFMNGEGPPGLDREFVARAQYDDISRWSEERKRQPHVSDARLEQQAVDELLAMCAEGDAVIAPFLALRSSLGYGEACRRP